MMNMAKESDFKELINPNAKEFLAPDNMIKAIRTSGKNDAILNKYRKICNELGVKLSIGG